MSGLPRLKSTASPATAPSGGLPRLTAPVEPVEIPPLAIAHTPVDVSALRKKQSEDVSASALIAAGVPEEVVRETGLMVEPSFARTDQVIETPQAPSVGVPGNEAEMRAEAAAGRADYLASSYLLNPLGAALKSYREGLNQSRKTLARAAAHPVTSLDRWLGAAAGVAQGAFTAATPASPALLGFTGGMGLIEEVAPEPVKKAAAFAMQPITQTASALGYEPTDLAGQSALELGDILAVVGALHAKSKLRKPTASDVPLQPESPPAQSVAPVKAATKYSENIPEKYSTPATEQVPPEVAAVLDPPRTVTASPRGELVVREMERRIAQAKAEGTPVDLTEFLTSENADLIGPSPSLTARVRKALTEAQSMKQPAIAVAQGKPAPRVEAAVPAEPKTAAAEAAAMQVPPALPPPTPEPVRRSPLFDLEGNLIDESGSRLAQPKAVQLEAPTTKQLPDAMLRNIENAYERSTSGQPKPEIVEKMRERAVAQLFDYRDRVNGSGRYVGRQEDMRKAQVLAARLGYDFKYDRAAGRAKVLDAEGKPVRPPGPDVKWTDKVENPVLMEDLPPERRDRVTSIMRKVGNEIDVDMEKRVIDAAAKDIEKDAGKESTERAQTLLRALLRAEQEGYVGVKEGNRRIGVPLEELLSELTYPEGPAPLRIAAEPAFARRLPSDRRTPDMFRPETRNLFDEILEVGSAAKTERPGGPTKPGDPIRYVKTEAGDQGVLLESQRVQPSTPIRGPQNAIGEAGTPLFDQVKPTPRSQQMDLTAPRPIEDFGEKIGGARKDEWKRRGLTLEDIQAMNDRERVQHITKDNTWPKPDYGAMVDAGADPLAAYLVKQVRDKIETKPRYGQDVQKQTEHQQRYIDVVQRLRAELEKVKTLNEFRAVFNTVFGAYLKQEPSAYGNRKTWTHEGTQLAQELGGFAIKALNPGNWDLAKATRYIEQNKWPAPQEQWQRIARSKGINTIHSEKGDFFVERHGRILQDGFKTEAEAVAFTKEYLKQRGYFNPKTSRFEERPVLEDVVRTGEEYRKGADVTEQQLQETFGFRGGEFGNWESQRDRQMNLNHAHDALRDLATVLNIPPRAVSLNGELAIAFGARGKGGKGAAFAHYEPDRVVINLTKTSGAGALAHEWGHALDDYFSRIAGTKPGTVEYLSERNLAKAEGLRPEMRKAWENVIETMSRRIASSEELVADTKAGISKAGRNLESWLASVRRLVTTPEAQAQFDELANVISAGVDGRTEWGKLQQLVKDVHGRVIDMDTRKAVEANLTWKIGLNDRVQRILNGEITDKRPTSYAKESQKLDEGSKSRYWSQGREMFARAFEAYIHDRIAAAKRRSDYLVAGTENAWYTQGKPYPEGIERTAIQSAFDRFVETLKTKETDKGIALYNVALGAGLGIERDEEGNWRLNPSTALLGVMGGAAMVKIAPKLRGVINQLQKGTLAKVARGEITARQAGDAMRESLRDFLAEGEGLRLTLEERNGLKRVVNSYPFRRSMREGMSIYEIENKAIDAARTIEKGLSEEAAGAPWVGQGIYSEVRGRLGKQLKSHPEFRNLNEQERRRVMQTVDEVFKQRWDAQRDALLTEQLGLAEGGQQQPVGIYGELKDIGNLAKGLRDLDRNFEAAFGPQFDTAKKTFLDPFYRSKGRFVDFQERYLTELKEKIVDGLGIKKGSDESAVVQLLGEKEINGPQAIARVGADRIDAVTRAEEWFRGKYDELLTQVNAVRAEIYPNNPEKLIPKRRDYFRHYREMAEGLGGLINSFETPSGIDPQIVGKTPWTKPKSRWLSFAQRRVGKGTQVDAVGGFLDYVPDAAYAVHIDPHIQKFRNLADALADATGETKHLNNFIDYLRKFANDLSGKTNEADRAIVDFVPGGRTTVRALNWVNGRVKANTILGNVSSSIAQIFNVPQGIASAGRYSLNGVRDSYRNILGNAGPIETSPFIRERYSDRMYAQFDHGILRNTKRFARWMTGVLDEVGTRFIWNSHHAKALAEGIPDPVLWADRQTRRLVAGRGVGDVPLLQKSKLFQMVAPFQLEVTNLWWVMQDMVKAKEFGKLATLFVANYLFNKVAEEVKGSGVTFDPIQALVDSAREVVADPTATGAIKATGRMAGEVLSNMPLGQTIAATYPEFGVKDVMGSGMDLPTRKKLFGREDPTRYGSGLLVVRGLQDPLTNLALPYGGKQVSKTARGGIAVQNGGVYRNGKLLFRIDAPDEQIRALLFGPYGTKAANEDRQPVPSYPQGVPRLPRLNDMLPQLPTIPGN